MQKDILDLQKEISSKPQLPAQLQILQEQKTINNGPTDKSSLDEKQNVGNRESEMDLKIKELIACQTELQDVKADLIGFKDMSQNYMERVARLELQLRETN